MPRKSVPTNDYYEELIGIGPFGGIDDTTSQYFVSPSNFVDALNIIPNTNYGGYTTVPGRVLALGSNLPGVPYGIGCMQRAGMPDLYFFALDAGGVGEIWYSEIGGTPTRLSLPIALTAGARIAYFVPSRKWLFFTNGIDTPLKISTSIVATFWGMVAPSTAPTVASSGSGPLTGVYYYCETFSNSDQESSQGAISDPITLTGNSATITPTATTTDPQVTTRNLYRLGGSLGGWYLVNSQSADDFTPFVDIIADGPSIGTPYVTGQALVVFRDPPPVFTSIAGFQDRIVGFGVVSGGAGPDPTAVWWSNYNEPWGFNPETQVLEAGPNDFNDVAVTCGSIGTYLLLLKTRSTFALVGNSDTTFTVIELFPEIGCDSPSSLAIGDNNAIWDCKRAIQYFDGSNRLDISDGQYQQSNVKTFFRSLSSSDRAKSVGFFYDRMFFMSYPSVNTTVVFDTRTSQWFKLGFACSTVYYDAESDVPIVGNNLEVIGQIDEWFGSTTNGDLGDPISAFVRSRVSDIGAIEADKELHFFYVEGPVQDAAVDVGIFLNPGPRQQTVWRGMNLSQSGTTRQRWEMPTGLVAQAFQMELQTTALEQVTIWRASLQGIPRTAVHQPSSPTDFGGSP